MSAEYQEQIPHTGHPGAGWKAHCLGCVMEGQDGDLGQAGNPREMESPRRAAAGCSRWGGGLRAPEGSGSWLKGPSTVVQLPSGASAHCSSTALDVTQVYVTMASPMKTRDLGSKSSFLDV